MRAYLYICIIRIERGTLIIEERGERASAVLRLEIRARARVIYLQRTKEEMGHSATTRRETDATRMGQCVADKDKGTHRGG